MGEKVRVEIDGVKKKISRENFNKGQYAMANNMLADMNQFVPYKSRTLRGTGHLLSDGSQLMWNTKYAKAQYYGRSKHASWSKGRMPGTGPKWDQRAKKIYMRSWKKTFMNGSGF